MNNPLTVLAPQLFGEYPRPFEKLYGAVSISKEMDNDEVKLKLWKAYEFGLNYHKGQKRQSGEPFFNHCIAVASTLADWQMDLTTIIAGLLHDTVEDTDATLDELKDDFGNDVADLVDGVSKISGIEFSSRKEKQVGNFMKMLLSVAKDLRVIIIKFADRLHNMETIGHMSQIKQHRVAVETREIYAPLAHRLGMSSVKSKLDDLVLKTINPTIYKEINAKVKTTNRQRKKFIQSILKPIQSELNKYDIKPKIYGRPKSLASIYGKMVSRNKEFEEIYDLYALRIVVEKVEHCYLALGIVHSLYNPIQERFKDFIAMPKSNGYQSVHTTVVGPDGRMMEIQIRTVEMEETAEIGVAAHWVYKGGKSAEIDKNVKWLRELLEILQNESADPKEFMDLLKIDLFSEEIFVFTPAGDLIQLPVGATPVDFAFQVHTQVGMHCMGAKVNHSTVPLNTKLKNGDMVEIITGKKQMPSYGWQKYIVTSKARNQVSKYLKKLRDKESIKIGVELLEKTLRRLKMTKDVKEFKGSFERFGYSNSDTLLKEIGTGNITIRDMLRKLRPQKPIENDKLDDDESSRFLKFSRSAPAGIVLDGIDNLMVNFGKCCNPIPGDDLMGFITRGRGVTVHISSCKSLPLLVNETDRLIPVNWNVKRSDYFNVRLRIMGQDYKGWLKDISECISNQNVNIASVDIKVNDSLSSANLIVQVNNNRQLNRLMKKISNLKNIDYVERAGR
tara:strand:- start:2100 stop:4289 length:2190 start_codon:yes stop_codon:yes gene_type:complete